MLRLSEKAKHELKGILTTDYCSNFPDDQLNDIGTHLLRLTGLAIKRKGREIEASTDVVTSPGGQSMPADSAG